MKIRSMEELQNELDKDISWRKKELSTLKLMIEKARNHEVDILIRGGVALLYAHWEGFIKYSATCYLAFIERQKLRYNQLQYNILALAMKKKILDVSETNKANIINEVAKLFIYNMSDKAEISYENSIETKANLNSEVLENITQTAGFDFSSYRLKSNLIDVKLLKSRNEIAHGERTRMTQKEFEDLHEEITQMIEHFKTQIENSASQKLYMIKT